MGEDQGADCTLLEGEGPSWVLRCGGEGREVLTGLALGGGGDILVGFELAPGLEASKLGSPFTLGETELSPQEADFALASFDPGGGVNWARQFGGSKAQYIEHLAGCGEGIFVSGSSEEGQSVDLGAGDISGDFMAVFDGEGELVWQRSVELLGDFSPHVTVLAAACDEAGSVVVTGQYRDGVNLGGDPLLRPDPQQAQGEDDHDGRCEGDGTDSQRLQAPASLSSRGQRRLHLAGQIGVFWCLCVEQRQRQVQVLVAECARSVGQRAVGSPLLRPLIRYSLFCNRPILNRPLSSVVHTNR